MFSRRACADCDPSVGNRYLDLDLDLHHKEKWNRLPDHDHLALPDLDYDRMLNPDSGDSDPSNFLADPPNFLADPPNLFADFLNLLFDLLIHLVGLQVPVVSLHLLFVVFPILSLDLFLDLSVDPILVLHLKSHLGESVLTWPPSWECYRVGRNAETQSAAKDVNIQYFSQVNVDTY